jgi:hypothetical protein
MQLKPVDEFSKSDLDSHRAFSAVVAQSNLDIKGNAIVRVAQLKMWFDGLEKKIEGTLKREALEKAKKSAPKIKKIGK